MKNRSSHEENNEIIIAQTKRENAKLGRDASVAILSKLNNILNNLYILLRTKI